MITLNIAKLLEDNGYGSIDTDIFLEEAPLNTAGVPIDGLTIVSRSTALDRFNVRTQQFDIYSRYTNKLTGFTKLEEILDLLQDSYSDVCTLPAVEEYSDKVYNNVRIRPLTGIQTVGADEQDRVVRFISATVQFES